MSNPVFPEQAQSVVCVFFYIDMLHFLFILIYLDLNYISTGSVAVNRTVICTQGCYIFELPFCLDITTVFFLYVCILFVAV